MAANKKKSSFSRLAALTLPCWRPLLFCVVCVVLVNAAELLKPYILKILIDDFLTGGQTPSGLHSPAGLSVLYFLAILLGAGAALVQARLINRVGQGILHDLRVKIFSHIHRMRLSALDRYGTGRLITRATNDVETLNEFYSDVLVNLFRDVLMLAGIVVVMLNMDAGLALVGFAAVPLIVLVTLTVKRFLKRNFARMKALIGRINGFFAENMAGMRIVQAFNRQKEKMAEFRDLNKKYFKTTMLQVTMNSVLRPVMEVINSMAIALLIAYGYNRISGGLLEIGVLYAFTTYIKQFFDPINDLAEKYNTIQSALVSADRIWELLDDPEPPEDLTGGTYGGPVRGQVEFRHVWFAYEGEEWVLKDVSFTVDIGGRVAFVGATGAGKTTIINLISRFYEPNSGQILVDGVDIKEWKLGELRRGVAVVLQDVVLFSGSIADNIRVNAEMADEEVIDALKQSMALEFVMDQPGQLYADVAERGTTFSTGERQLLSFARAIAHDPAILVLDEATANIDTVTEQKIQASIESISQDRTTIFIAHRLSTIRTCDRIFVLNKGRIVESGCHEDLLGQGGLYRRLYDAQFEEEIAL
jgi:ATP-binding cassette subfamily B multidrug efflux pump